MLHFFLSTRLEHKAILSFQINGCCSIIHNNANGIELTNLHFIENNFHRYFFILKPGKIMVITPDKKPPIQYILDLD